MTRAKVVVGLVVAVLGVLLVTSIDWSAIGKEPRRSGPVNTRDDQRMFVGAKVSVESDQGQNVAFDASWSHNGVSSPVDHVSFSRGWDYPRNATAWQRQFGPFKRGDVFTLTTIAPPGPEGAKTFLAFCALHTVGKSQRTSPPQMVSGMGQASCQITVGD